MTVTHRETQRVVKDSVRVVYCDRCGGEGVGDSPVSPYQPVGWYAVTARGNGSARRIDLCSTRCLVVWAAEEMGKSA